MSIYQYRLINAGLGEKLSMKGQGHTKVNVKVSQTDEVLNKIYLQPWVLVSC